MNETEKWIHDDITWCVDESCPLINCMRNQANMADRFGFHSYADFRQCDECAIYRMEQQMELERNDEK